jgi:hypothetical protein
MIKMKKYVINQDALNCYSEEEDRWGEPLIVWTSPWEIPCPDGRNLNRSKFEHEFEEMLNFITVPGSRLSKTMYNHSLATGISMEFHWQVNFDIGFNGLCDRTKSQISEALMSAVNENDYAMAVCMLEGDWVSEEMEANRPINEVADEVLHQFNKAYEVVTYRDVHSHLEDAVGFFSSDEEEDLEKWGLMKILSGELTSE